MVSATDGSAFTDAVTCFVTGDGGTQAQGTVGSGACTHEGNGFHTYTPSQAETNFDHVAFTFTGTGAIPVTVQLYTTFPQTGDSFARLGAPAGASVSADIAAIEAQTDDIGAAGAGLTAIPWNSAWDAEVQSEVADALAAYDPPTHAELTSGLDALPTAAEIRAEMDSNSTQLAAIVADTSELQTDWADGGRLDLILDARASQSSVDTIDNFLDTEIAAILEDTGTTIPATLSTIAGYIDTEVAAILVDTGTTLDGKLDTIDGIVDAIKAKTDSLTFTNSGVVDANITHVISDPVVESSEKTTNWGGTEA